LSGEWASYACERGGIVRIHFLRRNIPKVVFRVGLAADLHVEKRNRSLLTVQQAPIRAFGDQEPSAAKDEGASRTVLDMLEVSKELLSGRETPNPWPLAIACKDGMKKRRWFPIKRGFYCIHGCFLPVYHSMFVSPLHELPAGYQLRTQRLQLGQKLANLPHGSIAFLADLAIASGLLFAGRCSGAR
jgi:hypothetical protein